MLSIPHSRSAQWNILFRFVAWLKSFNDLLFVWKIIYFRFWPTAHAMRLFRRFGNTMGIYHANKIWNGSLLHKLCNRIFPDFLVFIGLKPEIFPIMDPFSQCNFNTAVYYDRNYRQRLFTFFIFNITADDL
jgi:hypothetical protein